jgi:hypothetical protein
MQMCVLLQVLLQLCQAHLQAGDAKLALRCLENAGLGSGASAASLPPDAQLMVMRVKLEAGRQAEVSTQAIADTNWQSQ